MDNYIRVYEDVLDEQTCKDIIQKFEMNIHQHEEFQEHFADVSFTQIDFGKHIEWVEETRTIYNVLAESVARYANDCNIKKTMWPLDFSYESIRVKRYLPNDQDQFGLHVDVNNLTNAKRFLAFFIYLDNNEEGETMFPYRIRSPHFENSPIMDEFVSSCKRGNILIFPPMWPWAHAGRKPSERPKYIIGSYLHYK